jgi:MFS family permease
VTRADDARRDSLTDSRSAAMPLDYWKYLVGQALSALGSSFTMFALPLLVFRLTGSASALAVALATSFLPYLLFGLPIGALTDRLDRRRMMIVTDLVRAAVLTVPALLLAADRLSVIVIYVASFMLTTGRIFFDAGAFAGVTRLVGPDHLVTANGRLQAAFSASRIAGPALAGFAVAVAPLFTLLLVDAATFVVSAVSLWLVHRSFNELPTVERATSVGEKVRSVGADIAEGLRYVWRMPVLRSIAILMSLVNLLDATVLAQIVLLAKEDLAASDSQVAWLFVAANAGVLLLSLAAGRLRRLFAFSRLALGSQIGCGLAVAVLGLTRSYVLGLVLWALYSGLAVLFNINATSLRQQLVPDELLGRVMSISAVLAWSSVPLGALVGGAVISAVDVGPVYVGIGGIVAVLATGFFASPLGRAERYLPSSIEKPIPSTT